jgi:energy-coupling factor transporter ATP-binding protein EcfA2
VAGSELTDRDGAAIRRKLGILFQDPDDQLFGATIIEDVAFGLRCLGENRDFARRKALGALSSVGLLDVAERAPQKLSYGERKRACLAGLLAYSPSIYLLDEPTANLDPRSRRQLIDLIKTSATTRLIATHDLELALALCPRSIVLDAGRIVADGPTPTLLADETLMEAHGLEVPLSLAFARRT